ncbi:transposase [Streptomyces avidinii]|uniref:transposase family protein n=1 Tax=Streptomyces avidinii TaxID=1895 RepID=UPI0038656AF1|nr:transposase [Streptomyces avidinii]
MQLRCGGPRSRPTSASTRRSRRPSLAFIDRLLATLVHLRHGVTHDEPACWFGVDRSTITRAIGDVRPLLETRGCTIAADIIDGTEIRVLRPAVGCKDREKFISGKNKQNAVKAMVLTDASGRSLFCGPAHPASCADITHARQLRTGPAGAECAVGAGERSGQGADGESGRAEGAQAVAGAGLSGASGVRAGISTSISASGRGMRCSPLRS